MPTAEPDVRHHFLDRLRLYLATRHHIAAELDADAPALTLAGRPAEGVRPLRVIVEARPSHRRQLWWWLEHRTPSGGRRLQPLVPVRDEDTFGDAAAVILRERTAPS